MKALTRGAPVLDSVAIFLLTAVLVFPLFRVKYLDNWASIESTFIGDARMLVENLPHPGWQPLWYCGTRFDYIYPLALRYGTALTSVLFRLTPARAYHLYVGTLYALGIVGVYWLAFAGTRSRTQGWLAAILTSVISPSLFFVSDLGRDSPLNVPQRLHVLMSYGEGPHISSVAVLGFALAASYFALKEPRPFALGLAGILCAGVVSHNLYGATALAILFPIMVWAVWLEVRRAVVWVWAVSIVLISYGLCAFWLTPSFVRINLINLQWVASPRTPWSRTIAIASVLIYCAISLLAARRFKISAWPLFVIGAAFILSIYVLGAFYFGYTFAGNGARLAPELDLAVILLATSCLAAAWRRPMLRSGAVVFLCLLSYPAIIYLRHAWTIYPHGNPESRCELRISKWMIEHLPGRRALSTGSIRFWYDAWYDNAEMYGGCDQGMLNQNVIVGNWEITQGVDPKPAIAWLQSFGTDAVIVPGKGSQEVYHDFAHPEKFRGVLPVLYDDHQGNVIYQVLRRFPAIARVVERASLVDVTTQTLDRYVAAIEHGPDSPVTLKWHGFDALDVSASTSDGQAVVVQETFDPAWHATADGHALRIDRDPMDFMLVNVPAGTHTIHMQFETPLENRIGQVITAITCAFLLGLLIWDARTRLDRRRNPTTAY